MGLEPTNLLTASQALYQLSYAPEGWVRLSVGRRGTGEVVFSYRPILTMARSRAGKGGQILLTTGGPPTGGSSEVAPARRYAPSASESRIESHGPGAGRLRRTGRSQAPD